MTWNQKCIVHGKKSRFLSGINMAKLETLTGYIRGYTIVKVHGTIPIK